MNRKISLLAPALFMLLPTGAALADSHDGCMSMLATSIGMELESEGFDMINACELTVSELVQIKNLLDTDGMGTQSQIQLILDRQ
jgi:hypothetical protein